MHKQDCVPVQMISKRCLSLVLKQRAATVLTGEQHVCRREAKCGGFGSWTKLQRWRESKSYSTLWATLRFSIFNLWAVRIHWCILSQLAKCVCSFYVKTGLSSVLCSNPYNVGEHSASLQEGLIYSWLRLATASCYGNCEPGPQIWFCFTPFCAPPFPYTVGSVLWLGCGVAWEPLARTVSCTCLERKHPASGILLQQYNAD